MKNTKKGILQLLLVVVVIASLSAVALVGVGKQHKGKAGHINLGLDLAGGVSITYQSVKENPSEQELKDTVYKLQKRVESFSTEAEVYQEGSNRINIDIPGVDDAEKVLAAIGKPGTVQFKDSEGNVLLDGSHIKDAQAGYDEKEGYVVSLTFNEKGASLFEKVTGDMIGKSLGVYYDGKLYTNPTVQTKISGGKAQIDGMSSLDEANEIATAIRSGALTLELKEIRSNVVGAKLGEEALNKSLLAGLVGFIIVLIFMIAVYRIPGVAASIALTLYVVLMLLSLNALNVTLTLPGIAGIILSIGMAVDANVIIFTRIKEELGKGKTVRSSIRIGFNKALSAIIDGNVTTLIAAAVLYFKGSGTVKGFATTLAIGIVLSMFTALAVTKFILNALFALGLNKEGQYGVAKEVKVRNYVGNMKKYVLISSALIIIGFAAMGINASKGNGAFDYSLDFKGGSSSTVPFNQEVNSDLIKKVEKSYVDITKKQPNISKIGGENTLIIKTELLDEATRNKVNDMLQKDFSVDIKKVETENISSTVSDEMKSDAVVAVIIATICMLLYIWVRFKDINFATSAVLALIHDVLVVLMVYAVLRISVGNTFIACMLTIVGYSINATIVIFDRIRENKGTANTPERLAEIVNTSISQTFTRSINTSLTTFIMIFVLYLFGVESLKGFALPLMAGIVCGAYSSICVTGTLWFFFKKKFAKKASK